MVLGGKKHDTNDAYDTNLKLVGPWESTMIILMRIFRKSED